MLRGELFLPLVVFVLQAEAQTSTTQNQPHQISNTQRTENKTTDVVIHQHSRKLLKMDILMSETCWAHNKWNKIASDIKLVFHSSTIAMIHDPINIRLTSTLLSSLNTWSVYRGRLCCSLPCPIKNLSDNAKQLKSALKFFLYFNSFYSLYEYFNVNKEWQSMFHYRKCYFRSNLLLLFNFALKILMKWHTNFIT